MGSGQTGIGVSARVGVACLPAKRPFEEPSQRVVRAKRSDTSQATSVLAPAPASQTGSGAPLTHPGPSRASHWGLTRGIVKSVRHQQSHTATPCWVFMDYNNLDVLLLALSRSDLHLERVYCNQHPPPPIVTALCSRNAFQVCPWPPQRASVAEPLGHEVVGLMNV